MRAPDERGEMVARAEAALARAAAVVDAAEPLRAVMVRGAEARTALVAFWQGRAPGSPRGAMRYRWELGHRVAVPMPAYAEGAWRAWRKGEAPAIERDRFEVEGRLLLPIVVAENVALLAAMAEEDDGARVLLEEAVPIVRRDVARYVAMNDAWEDTWALWCITREPRVLDRLHPLAVAIAVSYAAGPIVRPEAGRAPVVGSRFPYFGVPLVSASAQLAAALLALGSDLALAAALADHVRGARREDGAWSDDEEGEDVLTTVIAAELLAASDPSFDVAPTLAWLAARQGEDGMWRALGPEAPWLTARVIALAQAARRPFAARFAWPHRARSVIDQKTGLPFYAYFLDVADLMERLPGLAAARVPLAFIDLIGFRAFNNRHGQDAGDEVLRRFAAELATVPEARAVRDGGDEFLVVGAPGRDGMIEELRGFMAAWLVRFRAGFGDATPVVPRIVVGTGRGDGLRALRQRLGREITELKQRATIPEEGILVESEMNAAGA